MSGSIWASEAARAWRAERRNMRPFRNADDPMRGQPVHSEPQGRRRRRRPPQRSAEAVCIPRSIHRVTFGDPSTFALENIADHENLSLIWQQIRAFGGHAPGIDGMTFDISPSECFALLRNLSQALKNHRYVPAPTRPVKIRKSTGGHRTLEIPTIIDRVVGAALNEALRPILMNRLPRHYGAGASCHAILAKMTVQAEDHDWYWLAVDDIANFFPSIPRSLAMECFMREADRWGVPRPTLVQQGIPWLIRQLIYGRAGDTRAVGLSQGSTFSPLAAAIVLLEVLDLPMDRRIGNRMILHRFVDNIHLQGPDHSEVRLVMEDVQAILNRNGMNLKESGTVITDVRSPTRHTILGARPRWKNGRLLFDIPDDTWKSLKRKLSEATTGSGPSTAQPIVRGFITAHRPCLREKADSAINQIHKMMREGGSYSISKDTITSWVTAARDKWNSELESARNPENPQPRQEAPIELSDMETGPFNGNSPPWE